MGLAENVAKMRFNFHSNMIDIVNAGNQLGLIKDNKANELNKHHTMTIVNDILPRIYGREAVEKMIDEL